MGRVFTLQKNQVFTRFLSPLLSAIIQVMEQIQTILLDENTFFLSTLKKYLEHMDGITVITASQCASEAVASLTQLVPDLMIFNLALHDTNPLQFSKLVKKESPKSKMIAYANVDIGFLWKESLS